MTKDPYVYEGTEVKMYSYSHHTINKLETIKKLADWK
jgi:hypothetical protein